MHVCNECGVVHLDGVHLKDKPEFESHFVNGQLVLVKKEILNNSASKSGGKIRTKSKGGAGKNICEKCGKPCDSPFQLDRHVEAVHLKLKPYKCNQCNFASAHPSNLKKHVKSAHEKIRHQCDFCPLDFGEKSNLTRHIKRHHKY